MKLTPFQIAQKRMLANDSYSKWLGIEILEISFGTCTLRMVVRDDMLNGFKIGHGGITYSLSDSAFAFASNSHGQHAVSIETSISHIRPIKSGDILTAHAEEMSRTKSLGIYEIKVENQDYKTVALFKGTVFIKPEVWK